MKCPCHSQETYEICCGPYHAGLVPKTPVALMRSRYSAYAMGNIDYILKTTHPDHPDTQIPTLKRRQQIKNFCDHTTFVDLVILSEEEGEPSAFVTFHASLKQGDQDISFRERSEFIKKEGHWLYLRGDQE